jgi:hypothetical protein
MISRRWLGFGLLIVVIAILVTLRGASSNDSPEHSSASDAANGTSALRFYAQALGYSTSTVEGEFSLPSSHALLFVFSPVDSFGYSLQQAQQLQSWISAGNVVVYAAEGGDPDLDSHFGLHRGANGVDASAGAAAPVLGGVNRLSGAITAAYFQPAPGQVPLLRNAEGRVLAVRSTFGSGVLIALTDPLVLCNAYLGLANNGRFAADLLAMTPAGGSVLFDEYHHGAVAGGASPAVAWIGTPWGAALALAVLFIFGSLAMRGRSFGPTIALDTVVDRSSAEYAAAVGSLLHRTGARSITLQTLFASARRAVAERVGLSSETPMQQLNEALRQRNPVAGQELAAIEARLSTPMESEQDVLAVARRLHNLAYPSASITPMNREQS